MLGNPDDGLSYTLSGRVDDNSDYHRFATYRIAVGKRHKIGPGAIVGALANEGGLHRSDFGHITIKPDFSLVELPAKLPHATLKALEKTRISGVLINLQPDRAAEKNRRGGRGAPRREHKG